MKLLEQVNNYISENDNLEKKEIIKRLSKKFGVSEDSAKTYYYNWKRYFMKSVKCEPQEEIKNINDRLKVMEATIIKGKYGIYIKDKNKLIAGDITFKTIRDIEEYKKKEIELFYKRLSEILDVMKLEV